MGTADELYFFELPHIDLSLPHSHPIWESKHITRDNRIAKPVWPGIVKQ
jgi:hypothetical protein